MTTQAEYFQTTAVDGDLTDAQMQHMLLLPEGDSEALFSHDGEPDSVTGNPPETPAVVIAPAGAPAPEPVLLAKDGVHTISYDKLVDAREEARANKELAEARRLEIEALKQASTPAPAPAPAGAPAPEGDDGNVFGDFSDEELKKGILKVVAAQVDARLAAARAPVEAKELETAETLHFKTINDAHPNVDAMLESTELEAWISAQPKFAQPGIRAVLKEGTAPEVIEVFDSYVKATGKPAPAPAKGTPAKDPAVAAQEAIAAAQSRPPTSLSEIPGSTAQHDEAGALAEMTPTALMKKFEGKSPEQIEALLARSL